MADIYTNIDIFCRDLLYLYAEIYVIKEKTRSWHQLKLRELHFNLELWDDDEKIVYPTKPYIVEMYKLKLTSEMYIS